MFMIVPKPRPTSSSNKDSTEKDDKDTSLHAPTRVSSACDRCRLRKAKCNGQDPCDRCRWANVVCVNSGTPRAKRGVAISEAYVSMLKSRQQRLTAALMNMQQIIEQKKPQREGLGQNSNLSDGIATLPPAIADILEQYAPRPNKAGCDSKPLDTTEEPNGTQSASKRGRKRRVIEGTADRPVKKLSKSTRKKSSQVEQLDASETASTHSSPLEADAAAADLPQQPTSFAEFDDASVWNTSIPNFTADPSSTDEMSSESFEQLLHMLNTYGEASRIQPHPFQQFLTPALPNDSSSLSESGPSNTPLMGDHRSSIARKPSNGLDFSQFLNLPIDWDASLESCANFLTP